MELKNVYSESLEYLKETGIAVDGDKLRKEAIKRTQNAISNHLAELVDVTNSSALNSEEIAEGIFNGIINNHRYLQNEFWIAMVKVIEKYGNLGKDYYDARNEFAVKDCKAMGDAISNERYY